MKDNNNIISENKEIICGIWREVLQKEIDADENIMRMGVSSLDATKFVAILKRDYNLDVKLITIFESENISNFVKRLDGKLIAKDKKAIKRGEV